MTRLEVQAAARTWLGVKFRHQGRSTAGLDCIGLLVMVGQHFGVPHTDYQHYTGWPDPQRRILAVLNDCLERRPAGEIWDGTIGVFAQERLPCHVGIFSRKHGMVHLIHAMMARRVVLEEPFQQELGGNAVVRQFRMIRRYGFPGLED